MGSYRRVHQWAFLIHRPLAPGRIFLALSAAAGLWFTVVLALPQVVTTLYLELVAGHSVDLRQYLLIPFLLGISASFYLAGCYVSLSPSRGAFLVALLPYFFLTRQAEGLWIFLPQLVVLAWLACLAYAAFKPDLSSPLRPSAVVASALPMQVALFWLLVGASTLAYQSSVVVQEEGWGGFATHRWDDHFPAGTYLHTQYLRGAAALGHGLADATSERARYLAKQIQLAEVLDLSADVRSYPTRGQLMFADRRQVLQDAEQAVAWSFRHDPMLFEGRHRISGAPAGWLGTAGQADEPSAAVPFEEVPTVIADRFLLTRRHLYEFDGARGQVRLRFQVAAPERLATAFEQKASVLAVLTDRALRFFDPRDLRQEAGEISARATLPLPGQARDLDQIQVAELLDGYLVSLTFGTRSEAGYGPARQVVVEVGLDGGHEVVAERTLGPGWPAWYRHRGFILSPVLQHGHDLAWAWIAPQRPDRVALADIARRKLPRRILLWALLVASLSAALTAWAATSRELSRGGRWAWVAAAFWLGLPALLSFLALHPHRPAAGRRRALPALRRWSWRTAP